jgi:hypothetical protein
MEDPMVRRIPVPVFGLLASFLLYGCAGPRVMPARSHAPSDPAAVMLYQQPPPKKYEVLGKVEVTENLKWQDNGDVTAVVDELKDKAARLGANGLLLTIDPSAEPDARLVGGNYQGTLYRFPFRDLPFRTAYARAIHVYPK